MRVKLQDGFWLIFLLFGLLQMSSGLQSLCILCREPEHWNWLSNDPEVLDYLNVTWRWIGVTSMAFGLILLVITVTGYVRRERWAWFVMWIWPAYLITQGITFPYTWPMMGALLFFSLIALIVPIRRFFPNQIV